MKEQFRRGQRDGQRKERKQIKMNKTWRNTVQYRKHTE